MLIPTVLDQSKYGERAYDLYSRLLKDRIVFCMGEIEDNMSTIIVGQLLYLASESPTKPINLYVNSPGGAVTAGLAIYDTMQFIKPPVHTIVMGQACSMGSFIAMGGEPGHRYALPLARIMTHQPSGGSRGMASDIEIQATEIIRIRKTLHEEYAKRCGRTIEEVNSALDRDRWFTAQEAMDWGLIDKIITRDDLAV